ncbi:MAG: methylisocitrate lyase, partial [Burkholderiales bacterium]
ARLAERAGHKAFYLSGGGLAANSLGVPDLGISVLEDLLIDVRRITDACPLPLLVDADTGFGGAFNIARTVRSLVKAGAAGMHIEDQVSAKRCGHRPNKALVPPQEMVDRIKAAVDARTDASFVIMARTDAVAVEGMPPALDRIHACIEAGADMIFPEALTTLEEYRAVRAAIDVPFLANITEFGRTPLFATQELGAAGVDIILYCCGAYRAMNHAAMAFYQAVIRDGHQRNVIGMMQTREEMYEVLAYHEYEKKLDELFAGEEPE